MNNVSLINNCYGCGVCSASCPKKIISINLNKDGYYEPNIRDLDKCIDCGICLDVCAFNHNELALKYETSQIKSWAAWSNNEDIRSKRSSGGLAYEIGRQLIEQGYQVVGCRYDVKEQRAEHYIVSSVIELGESIGSKYIQSYTENAFRCIKHKNQKYLVIGTPCQIDSFRRMIKKFHSEENFILIDFYCHGVPSMHAWRAYVKMLEAKVGKITYASWRNKIFGWHDSYTMVLKGNNGSCISRRSDGDLFYKLFLCDICVAPQCVKHCKYKSDHSSADIRIGDLWDKTYKKDNKGVSALVSFSDKGRSLIEGLKNITLVEHPFKIITEGQMKSNAKASPFRNSIIQSLAQSKNINLSLKIRIQAAFFYHKMIRWFNKLKKQFNNLMKG